MPGPVFPRQRRRFMERLVLSWVGKEIAFELMPGLNRLGRNPTNDFRIADASLSSFHCEITLTPDNTVHIRDLASTNGTYIDGLQVAQGELTPGQALRLGTVELRLEKATIAEPVRATEPVFAGGIDQGESWKSDKSVSFLGKLTKTLRIPFTR
jgi:pSer/pThr/pTyr-binding forkhead associated (FHA) protein